MSDKEQSVCAEHLAPRDLTGRSRPQYYLAVLIGVVVIISSFLFLDQEVRERFHRHPNSWHQHAWVDGFRQLGKAYVVIWLLLLWSWLIDRWRAVIVILVSLILVAPCVCSLKVAMHRPRPRLHAIASGQQSAEGRDILSGQEASFPSGDAAVAFAVATVLSASPGRRWAPLLFTAAAGIGLLRITTLAHYPSDVLAGAMIGILCGFWALRVTAHRQQLDAFHLRGMSHALAGLALFLVPPLASRFFDMKSMRVFLDAYGIPLLVLILIYLAAPRLWAFFRASRYSSVHDSATMASRRPLRRSLWDVRWRPSSEGRMQRASRTGPRAIPRSSRQGHPWDSERRDILG